MGENEASKQHNWKNISKVFQSLGGNFRGTGQPAAINAILFALGGERTFLSVHLWLTKSLQREQSFREEQPPKDL